MSNCKCLKACKVRTFGIIQMLVVTNNFSELFKIENAGAFDEEPEASLSLCPSTQIRCEGRTYLRDSPSHSWPWAVLWLSMARRMFSLA